MRIILQLVGPLRGLLATVAAILGVAKASRFLGSRSDVPALLAACDVVALTSHNEAAPVSILEALSTGVPVVSANVGSVSETVIPDETGRLFPAGDVAAYAQNVIDLLANPAARRRIGAEGRRRVMARWSLQAMVHGYEQLIEGILAAKSLPLVNSVQTAPTTPATAGPPGPGGLGRGYRTEPRFR